MCIQPLSYVSSHFYFNFDTVSKFILQGLIQLLRLVLNLLSSSLSPSRLWDYRQAPLCMAYGPKILKVNLQVQNGHFFVFVFISTNCILIHCIKVGYKFLFLWQYTMQFHTIGVIIYVHRVIMFQFIIFLSPTHNHTIFLYTI